MTNRIGLRRRHKRHKAKNRDRCWKRCRDGAFRDSDYDGWFCIGPEPPSARWLKSVDRNEIARWRFAKYGVVKSELLPDVEAWLPVNGAKVLFARERFTFEDGTVEVVTIDNVLIGLGGPGTRFRETVRRLRNRCSELTDRCIAV